MKVLRMKRAQEKANTIFDAGGNNPVSGLGVHVSLV